MTEDEQRDQSLNLFFELLEPEWDRLYDLNDRPPTYREVALALRIPKEIAADLWLSAVARRPEEMKALFNRYRDPVAGV